MRRVFHRQLLQLIDSRDQGEFMNAELEAISRSGGMAMPRVGPFRFWAIVRERLNLVCDLDILFLRRENPGKLIGHGGDLDNRIEVLFDSLRMPQDEHEIRGLAPQDGENLFVCLAEDDNLITGFRVTTDRLLEPANSESEHNNVRLIINVEIKATKLTEQNMAYFSHF